MKNPPIDDRWVFSAFQALLGGLNDVLAQHQRRDAAHAARHGTDRLRDLFGLRKAHVAAEPSVRADVHAHVHDDLPRAQEGGVHQPRPARGAHQNIRRAAQRGQVLRLGVADGHRGVALHQQQGERPAHHKAAADDHGVLAAQGHAVVVQQLQTGLRRAGAEALSAAREESGERGGPDPVHILLRVQPTAHHAVVDRRGQGPQRQAAVNPTVRIDPVDGLQHGLRGRVLRQRRDLGGDAQRLAALCRRPLVGEVALVVPHAQDRKTRLHAAL